MGNHPVRGGATRYRVRIARGGEARELTHLGQIEALRRAVLRSGLPGLSPDGGPGAAAPGAVPSSSRRGGGGPGGSEGGGKRTRPRLSFGPAISMGYESEAEYFDLELESPEEPREVAQALTSALPAGFRVMGVRRIPRFFPSLDSCINVVRYEVGGAFPADGSETLRRFLDRGEIPIEKVKKGGALVERVDARPLIIDMSLAAPDRVRMTLRFGPKRTLKPEVIIREWLGGAEGLQVIRKELFSETASGELIAP